MSIPPSTLVWTVPLVVASPGGTGGLVSTWRGLRPNFALKALVSNIDRLSPSVLVGGDGASREILGGGGGEGELAEIFGAGGGMYSTSSATIWCYDIDVTLIK